MCFHAGVNSKRTEPSQYLPVFDCKDSEVRESRIVFDTMVHWRNRSRTNNQVLYFNHPLTLNTSVVTHDCSLENYARILGLTSIFLFIIFGAAGNIVVAGIMVHKRRSFPLSTTKFIITLAISDLLTCLIVMPFDVVYWLYFPAWSLQPWLCKLWNALFYTLHASASLLILTISADTYKTVSDPMNENSSDLMRKPKLLISLIWSWSIAVGLLIFAFQKTPPPGEYLFDLHPVAYASYLVVHMVMPQVITSYFYFKLFRIARVHAVSIKTNQVSANTSQKSNDALNFRERIILVKTFLFVTIAYFFCWTPFLSVQFIYVSNMNVDWCLLETLDTVLCWLAYLQCCLNPVIYAIRKKLFRQLFKRVLDRVM